MDESGVKEQEELRRLFHAAAAMSIAVVDSLDAEPEMARFAAFVAARPSLRGEAVSLLAGSFSEDFRMTHPPVELWRYCCYALRWPELRDFIAARREEDVAAHGARVSGVWQAILEAFDDGWEGAKYFRSLNRRGGAE